MEKKENNYAYIDGANLYEALKELKWKLDYKRFATFYFYFYYHHYIDILCDVFL